MYDNLVYCSGQIPLDPKTGQLVKGDIIKQTTQSLNNIKAILKKDGGTMNNLLKLSIYLHDINDFQKMNDVLALFLKGSKYPTRTVVGGVDLPRGAKIKIDAIAIKR
ncbi:MAG: Rid family detoxifying hydrolase [Bacilli bacterium]|nr:Rid family detoxifying hydrolase [Bacilli bacterium]